MAGGAGGGADVLLTTGGEPALPPEPAVVDMSGGAVVVAWLAPRASMETPGAPGRVMKSRPPTTVSTGSPVGPRTMSGWVVAAPSSRSKTIARQSPTPGRHVGRYSVARDI